MLLPDEHMAGGQLADVAEDRVRGRNRVEGEKRLESVEVDVAARERAELRRELERAARVAVIERLDAVAVAGEHEAPPLRVPERNREHAAQAPRELGAVLLVEMQVHLRVAVGAKHVALSLELAAQLGVVVDLPVLDDGARPVLVRDRLVAAGEVDDREAPRGETDGAVDVLAAAVRAAMDEQRAHRREPVDVGGAASRRDSTDPAHRPNSMGGPGNRRLPAARLQRTRLPRAFGARRATRDRTASPRGASRRRARS